MRAFPSISTALMLLAASTSTAGPAPDGAATRLRGEVVDAVTGRPLPCRLYIEAADGSWRHAESVGGRAVRYDVARFGRSVERHTTLSAHPFEVELEPGPYTITAERGKEYVTATREVTVGGGPGDVRIELRRWIDMAARGWYSGDTHVHRALEDLPNLLLAEDLNVALPLLSWVTEAYRAPRSAGGDAEHVRPELIRVDATHVIWPRNTEYEIFTVGGARHTLGAFFVLGHREVFDVGVPPVRPVAEQARREGALLELDKHNWPWSMALVPVIDVDLFELANNHVWRTEFGFAAFGEREADWMGVERDERGFTERGWLEFGFRNWYALLDCGFRMRPTAGTASGVHPVPLGFGRVYVRVDGEFSYEKWMEGLDRGRSFVTTGPMLFIEANGKEPGSVFTSDGEPVEIDLRVRALGPHPIEAVELVTSGDVEPLVTRRPSRDDGIHEATAVKSLTLEESGWLAVRCFARLPGGRVRFAHGAPFHVDVAGRPLRPRREEVDYLIARVAAQIERSRDILPAAAIAEYEEALRAYRGIRTRE